MRTRWLTYFLLAFLTGAGISMVAAQSMESVTSQKERCLRKLEKAERSLETVTASIERVRRLRQASKESSVSSDAFIEKSQSKVEYLNNRIERTRNQLEKIESDLQNVQSGNQCPKCIAADVNLFCRQIESLYSENGGLMNEVNGFERSLRASVSVTELCKRNDLLLAAVDSLARRGNSRYQVAVSLQEKAHSAIASNKLDAAMALALEAGDSATALVKGPSSGCTLGAEIERVSVHIREARQTIDTASAGVKSATILRKAAAHLERGKTLCTAGQSEQARTELAIADKFTVTAIECAARGE